MRTDERNDNSTRTRWRGEERFGGRPSGIGHRIRRGESGRWRRLGTGWSLSATVHALLLGALAGATIAWREPGRELQLTITAERTTDALEGATVPVEFAFAEPPGASTVAELGGGSNCAIEDAVAITEPPLRPSRDPRRVELLAEMTSIVRQNDSIRAPSSPGGKTGPGGTAGPSAGQAEFFGIIAHGKRFVFVVDCSLSMMGPKWRDARYELTSSIERLGEDQSFYVVLFDGESHPMFAPGPAEPSLLPANQENFLRLRRWLDSAPLGFNTSPCLSMKRACELNPDAIFLLSDGEFSDPTAAYLRGRRRQRRNETPDASLREVVVHTVCFHSRDGRRMLERIAAENGGRCSVVETPSG